MVTAISKTVADPGTPERLTSETKRVDWACIQAKTTNPKSVIIGSEATVAAGYEIVNPGDSFVLWSTANRALAIDLNQLWAKVGAGGEGVDIVYVS